MAPPPPSGNQPDNSTGIIWGVAAAFVAVGVIWYVFKKQIVETYLAIKIIETDILAFIAEKLSLSTIYFDQLRPALQYAKVNADKISFFDLANIGMQVGEWLRYPFIGLLVLFAYFVYSGNTVRIFKRTYDMKSMVKLEKRSWPQIMPVADLDLLETDIDKGPWAMALTPMQFCKRYKLLEEVRVQRQEGMARRDWDKIDVILKRGEANKVFVMQLGPVWLGVDKLPSYIRALFAAFAARINADSKPAAALLKQLNESSTQKELNYSGVDALLKKHLETKLVQRILQNHAYVYTVMAAMLHAAREDGVQPSSDFLWLKPRDRRLWYMLNTVGRQTPFAEVAGPFAHWVAERDAGRKLIVPFVEEATKALELALKEVVYRPGEE